MPVMDEHQFRSRADGAIEGLRAALERAADEHGFEVEYEGGALNILFEEPEETRFVISPNAPVHQVWISALATSFKLGWSDAADAFVLEKTGEALPALLSRLISQQLGGAEVSL